MLASQEKPAHAGPAALPRAARLPRKEAQRLSLPAWLLHKGSPRRHAFPCPHGFFARKRRAFPRPHGFLARKRRAGTPAFASYGFPRKGAPRLSLATQLPRKEAQRPSLATRLPCKEEPRLLKRPSSRRAAPPQGNVVPFPGSLASLQGSAAPRLPFPRPNRPRGALALRGLLRLPLAWHVFSEGAAALGLCPALAVLLPSLGEELIQ